MSSLNISLPRQLKDYVEAQVAEGEYGTPSEYMRELIRRDKQRHGASIEKKLLKALAGGSIRIEARDLEKKTLVTLLQEKLSARSRRQ